MTTEAPAERETSWTQGIAAEIRAVAARKQVTQITIAKAIGMSQPALSRRWVGEIPYDLATLEAVLKFLDVSLIALASSAGVRCSMQMAEVA